MRSRTGRGRKSTGRAYRNGKATGSVGGSVALDEGCRGHILNLPFMAGQVGSAGAESALQAIQRHGSQAARGTGLENSGSLSCGW